MISIKRKNQIIDFLQSEREFYEQAEPNLEFSGKFIASVYDSMRLLRLGKSLTLWCIQQADLYKKQEKKFSVKHIVQIYNEMLDKVEEKL